MSARTLHVNGTVHIVDADPHTPLVQEESR
jgi:hypothetical protein